MIRRVLIVGLGSIGRRHATIARRLLPEATIGVLRHRGCDNEIEPGIDRCFTSLDDALQFRPEAAVIANPSSRHVDVALPLAASGAHLLIEKPISNSPAGVTALIDACRTRGIALMTGYNLRYSASLQEFRRLLGGRTVGRVLSVRIDVGQALETWRADSDYRTSVSANAALGGGVLLELSHEIDYARWLFGEIIWVTAVLRRQSRLEIDVEDTAHLIVGFAPAGEETPVVGTLTMDFVRQDTTRCCIAIGDTGSLRWDGVAGTVSLFEPSNRAWRSIFDHPDQRDDTYEAEWRHFLGCIRGSERPLVSGEDGLATLRVIEAARLSSATGAMRSIDSPDTVVSPERTA